jgi:hypothetical protein
MYLTFLDPTDLWLGRQTQIRYAWNEALYQKLASQYEMGDIKYPAYHKHQISGGEWSHVILGYIFLTCPPQKKDHSILLEFTFAPKHTGDLAYYEYVTEHCLPIEHYLPTERGLLQLRRAVYSAYQAKLRGTLLSILQDIRGLDRYCEIAAKADIKFPNYPFIPTPGEKEILSSVESRLTTTELGKIRQFVGTQVREEFIFPNKTLREGLPFM